MVVVRWVNGEATADEDALPAPEPDAFDFFDFFTLGGLTVEDDIVVESCRGELGCCESVFVVVAGVWSANSKSAFELRRELNAQDESVQLKLTTLHTHTSPHIILTTAHPSRESRPGSSCI